MSNYNLLCNKSTFMTATCVAIKLFSCNSKSEVVEETSLVNRVIEDYSPRQFAKILALSLKDETLRDFIR